MIFVPTILVEADVPWFSFSYSHGNKTLALATSIHVSTAEPPIILAIGERPPTNAESRRVDLFDLPIQPLDYSQYLVVFLRHATAMVTSGPAKFIRPRFHFRVSRRLAERVSGYHDSVLRSAALRAGAFSSERVVVEVRW